MMPLSKYIHASAEQAAAWLYLVLFLDMDWMKFHIMFPSRHRKPDVEFPSVHVET